ncbi:MAG TPA: hypothetical protein VFR97_01830 [Capillimicrobium sp.]|nr:hypothetical protein [Capillimicrobium sp.]
MDSPPTRVLIVAQRTAAAPELIEAVRERAARGACSFTLVVPAIAHGLHRVVNPEETPPDEAQAILDHALPLLSEAAGSDVAGVIGSPEPLTAVMDEVNRSGYDEIIVSTLPHRLSRWLRLDLPHKVGGLGLPVTTVTGREREEAEA